MNTPSLTLSLVALCTTLIAWVGVFFFAQSIHHRQDNTTKAIREYMQAHTSVESSNQMRALISATESTRTQIDEVLTIDILSLVEMVENAGTDAGVAVRVSNATPDVAPFKNNATQKSISSIRFSIEGQGTFGKLFAALALLENLPIPARIEEVTFLRQGENVNTPWTLQVRMRILTALPISS